MLLGINYNKNTKTVEVQGVDEETYTVNFTKEDTENIEIEISIKETKEE